MRRAAWSSSTMTIARGLWYESAFADQDPLAAQRMTEKLCLFAGEAMTAPAP